MISSIDKQKISSELEFSKNLIEGLTGKGQTSKTYTPKISSNDVSEIMKISEEVATISGLNQLKIKRQLTEDMSLQDKCLTILEQNRSIPRKTRENVAKILERTSRYELFLLNFLKKYS